MQRFVVFAIVVALTGCERTTVSPDNDTPVAPAPIRGHLTGVKGAPRVYLFQSHDDLNLAQAKFERGNTDGVMEMLKTRGLVIPPGDSAVALEKPGVGSVHVRITTGPAAGREMWTFPDCFVAE